MEFVEPALDLVRKKVVLVFSQVRELDLSIFYTNLYTIQTLSGISEIHSTG